MKFSVPLAASALLAVAAPLAAAEVQVTRFHTADSLANAAPGPISVRAGTGFDAGSLEARTWTDAVAAALVRQGFTVVADAPRVAVVSLEQNRVAGGRRTSGTGVSVGVGVGTGGGYGGPYYGGGRYGGGYYGGGYGGRGGVNVGLGMTFGNDRGGEALASTLAVTIESAGGTHAWEGRAETMSSVRGRGSDPRRLAGELADKLFAGFPGESGATIGAR